ncbi:hypothetical protein RHMOL_Rhmol11G0276400 [Rhododendron molle]|uniref:Uncharacterized protein n=1 Tax=Rhododendron molle TaxID=49168 RepID=A0ACC0LYK0_RHOML|nr:hypothetical protein RHMOL_Rhmol11G0276400 [Rhododendron molle]
MVILQLISKNSPSYHPLGNILLDCRSVIEEFEAVPIKHIYREASQCADALANDVPFLAR